MAGTKINKKSHWALPVVEVAVAGRNGLVFSDHGKFVASVGLSVCVKKK